MKSASKVRLFSLTLASSLLVSTVAYADNLQVGDYDELTGFEVNATLDLGDVCVDTDGVGTAHQAVKRTGSAQTGQVPSGSVFKEASTITVTVHDVDDGDAEVLTVEMDEDPAEIELPSDWHTQGNNTFSEAVSATVTLNTSVTGPFAGTVTFRASGTARNDSALRRDEALTVTAEVLEATHTDCITDTYQFTGFYAPVASVNVAKAGQSVPLKWNLYLGDIASDDEVISTTIGEGAYSITSRQVACDLAGGADVADAESAGQSGLRYDHIADLDNAAGHNVFAWKTQKAWANTCREIHVTYDGSDALTAMFRFTR